MKHASIRGRVKAFSLLELLVLLATLAILAAVLLPTGVHSGPSMMSKCMGHLRQVGIALTLFASDHNDQFPMQTSVTNGGSMEFVGTGSPSPHFQTVSDYARGNWGMLVCPSDKARTRAADHAVLSDRNISYFLSMDATYGRPSVILTGDRNLRVAGQPVKPGLFSLTTNAAVSWTSELHNQDGMAIGGNLLLGDGHVECSRRNLAALINSQDLATNRLAIP